MNILKNILIAGVLILCGFSYGHAQEGQPFDRAKNLAWLEHYLGVDADTITTELYNLLSSNLSSNVILIDLNNIDQTTKELFN